MVIRYILFWFVLMLVAIGNGMFREATYSNRVTELTAHQISTVTGILFTSLVVWGFSRARPLESQAQAWTVGITWLVLTLIFEFVFGHYVAGHSLERLLQDYNLLEGRVWSVFLIWIVVLPTIIYKLRHEKA